jgi:peptidoglycan/LPS O-acetylase OafA/YrhL
MTPQSSTFLDASRFVAAIVVLLSHLTLRSLNGVFPWVSCAHEAVIVFFVISGYVIGFVADTRENTPADFAAARLGRLYSVVAPALLLTVVLDAFGMAARPELYIASDHQWPALRILANLLFIQQSWNITVTPLSNGPFWSLAFEFWYYVMFAVWHFTRGPARMVGIGLALLCAGPRIAAFFPVWLLGLAAYRASRHWHPRAALRLACFLAAGLALYLLLKFGNPFDWIREDAQSHFPDWHLELGGMRLLLGDIPSLPSDLLVGVLFAAMVFCAQGPLPAGAWVARGAGLVRYLSGSTFSLYLFHAPVMYFFLAVFSVQRTSAGGIVLTGLATIASCIALSHVFERRVADYRRFFAAAICLLTARPRESSR